MAHYRNTLRSFFSLAIFLTLGSAYGRASVPSPLSTLRDSNEEIRKVLKQTRERATPELKQRVKKIVNGFLDYEELARRSLAQHWDKMSSNARQEFVNVFRNLIERNYVKQLRSNVDYSIDYQKEDRKEAEATVYSVVAAKRKGRAADTSVDYRLSFKQGHWMVFDVITDDVSLLRNYRSQFARIISREGYPALLAKMKKKLQETSE